MGGRTGVGTLEGPLSDGVGVATLPGVPVATAVFLAAALPPPAPVAGLTAAPTAADTTQVERSDPVADPAAVVATGDVRITVLTPALLRLEWAADGAFEDRASTVFLHRRLDVPTYEVRRRSGWLEIRTDRLTLRYREGSGRFDSANLRIRHRVADEERVWRPGLPDTANLGGTIRTLDGVSEPVDLGKGLLSRDGWALVDDSERPLLDDSPWPWVVPRPEGERQDWYFFGHGHRYGQALKDFTRVAGRIPMPPLFALGRWWSRYWAYTDRELMDLVRQFDAHDVPLDVLVVDMDWHETFELRWRRQPRDPAGQLKGWTGYTWNETYFPDPGSFLAWAGERGLRTPLNVHPASGIMPWEEQFPAMTRALGLDPDTVEYIPFELTDPDFARAYFEQVIHPLEGQGVDFWWLDWQQWHTTAVPGLTPTWWINHVFFTERARRGDERPLILHRYGGLGNHRYQIGFSGDARSTWTVLGFERYFTSTASNVGFGYWSHDIGGHAPGPVGPELYTRWIQFGVLSPALRTHTTKNPDAERRSWAYPYRYSRAMREALDLRHRLLPYLYGAARTAWETGVSMLRPLYYAHPETDAAYAFTRAGQYMLGPDLMAAPVARPVSRDSLVARKEVWLPEGAWVEWPTGARLEGSAIRERTFALDEIPLYARAGAVIPMGEKALRAEAVVEGPLVLRVVPGDSGRASVYRDAGTDRGYRRGAFTRRLVTHRRVSDGRVRIEVHPARGTFPGMREARPIVVRLPGRLPPEAVRWNGEAVPYARSSPAGVPRWTYRGEALETVVRLPSVDVRDAVRIDLDFPSDVPGSGPSAQALVAGVPGALRRLDRAVDELEELWPEGWAPESLVDLAQTGRRIGLAPDAARVELRRLRSLLPGAVRDVRRLRGEAAHVRRALLHLATVGELLDVELPTGLPLSRSP